MRKATLVVLVVTASLASAQYKPQPQAQAPTSPIAVSGAHSSSTMQFPRISQTDAFKLYQANKAVFVDVRSHEQFSYGHIKGSLSIPRSQILDRFNEILPGKAIILYCACGAEESAGAATASLLSHGVKNVFALKGGWQQWKSAKYPIQVGPK